jgi:hypothetical protein
MGGPRRPTERQDYLIRRRRIVESRIAMLNEQIAHLTQELTSYNVERDMIVREQTETPIAIKRARKASADPTPSAGS